MSKQELYAWVSLASSAALLGYYVLTVWGVPENIEQYADALQSTFLKVIGIAFLIELVLDLSRSADRRCAHKDERDVLIAGKGYRNAFFFLMAALVTVLANVLLSDWIGEATGERVHLAIPFATFHVLLLIVFLANITKAATQLFFYRRGIAHGAVQHS